MRPPVNRTPRGVELQMTAMIDVVFLLLVFFLWTSSFEKPENELSSSIAISGGGTASDSAQSPAPILQPFDDLVITLSPAADGSASNRISPQLRLNDQDITLDMLQTRLRQVSQLGVQPPVVIIPLPGVTIGEAIKVHDIARLAGLTQVLLAVNDE